MNCHRCYRKIAVQIAKHYGAKKVVVTGRNEETLKELLALGADDIIVLKQDDDAIISQIKFCINKVHSTL